MKDKQGRFYRLTWEPGDDDDSPASDSSTDQDRRRTLPAGEYTLTGYRLVRRDEQDTSWFISTTAPKIRDVVVTEGETQRVTIDPTIGMQCRTRPHHGSIGIQMGVQGEHHSGLSIYRDGKRIPIGYLVTDAQGRALAQGAMRYG